MLSALLSASLNLPSVFLLFRLLVFFCSVFSYSSLRYIYTTVLSSCSSSVFFFLSVCLSSIFLLCLLVSCICFAASSPRCCVHCIFCLFSPSAYLLGLLPTHHPTGPLTFSLLPAPFSFLPPTHLLLLFPPFPLKAESSLRARALCVRVLVCWLY